MHSPLTPTIDLDELQSRTNRTAMQRMWLKGAVYFSAFLALDLFVIAAIPVWNQAVQNIHEYNIAHVDQ